MGIVASQVGMIVLPAILFAVLLTRKPFESLHLRKPVWSIAAIAILLVFAIHPVAVSLALELQRLFPMPDAAQLAEKLAPLFADVPFWQQLLIIAVVPAICEEIAFRGLILSGFLQHYKPAGAILMSSILFGVSHMVPQQMIAATLLGIVLGMVATRTGSILPGILFHTLHNGMVVTYMHYSMDQGEVVGYPLPLVVIGGLVSVLLIGVLARRPSRMPRWPSSTLFDPSPRRAAVA